MPLKGDGFMVIWHDIAPEGEAAYHRWHTREHMPERLGIPGFLRGRRGVDRARDRHRYLTVYEGENLAVFGSPAYLARLNDPTPWPLAVQPHFRNFVRSACAPAASLGRGVGGAMATLRVPYGTTGEAGFRAAAPALAAELLALDGVNAVHVGTARPEVSGARTRETEIRGTAQDAVFDGVILVDGIGRPELAEIAPRIVAAVDDRGFALDPADLAVYDMAYCLDRDDRSGGRNDDE